MRQLLQALMRIPEAEALAAAVETGGCPAAGPGLGGVHRTPGAGGAAGRGHAGLGRPRSRPEKLRRSGTAHQAQAPGQG